MAITNIEIDETVCSEMGQLPEVVSIVEETANSIAARARDLAPVESGRYRAGIVVQRSSRTFADGTQSAAYVVRATDQKSAWIEFGNGRNFPAHFTLRTAVESLGLQFFKKGR